MGKYSDYDKAYELSDLQVRSSKLMSSMLGCVQKMENGQWSMNHTLWTLFNRMIPELENLTRIVEREGEND